MDRFSLKLIVSWPALPIAADPEARRPGPDCAGQMAGWNQPIRATDRPANAAENFIKFTAAIGRCSMNYGPANKRFTASYNSLRCRRGQTPVVLPAEKPDMIGCRPHKRADKNGQADHS